MEYFQYISFYVIRCSNLITVSLIKILVVARECVRAIVLEV